MNIGTVMEPDGQRLSPQTSQVNQKKKIQLKSNALLKAVASWTTYNDLLATKKVLAEWRHSQRNTDRKRQVPSKVNLHPLLTLVGSYCNDDDDDVNENMRKTLHVFLQFHMSKTSLHKLREMKNDARLIKTLCEMGASVIAENESGCSVPLEMALIKERLDLVDAMVEYSSKVTECNDRGNNILHVLLKNYRRNMGYNYNKKFMDIIDKSISKGVNLNQPNENGETPVLLAAKAFPQIIEKLARRGADLNCRTISGDNLLMLACKSSDHKSNNLQADLKGINWLLKHGFDVNFKNNRGFTPLHYASQDESSFALLKILVKAGADIHAVTHDGANPLNLATATCNFKAMRYFIERGVAFNRRDTVHSLTLMFMLTRDRRVEPVEWLISNGFDCNEKGNLSLLHLAAALGQVQIVKELLKRGANVDCQENIYGYTPLHLASMRFQLANVPELREAVLIDGKVNDGCVPIKIHTASIVVYSYFHSNGTCYGSTVSALLNAGANVNAKDRSGRTALHYATRQKDDNHLTGLLLQADASVDDVDPEGLSPLQHSLLSGNDRAVMYLLTFGADFNDIEHPRRKICEEIRDFMPGVSEHLHKLLLANLTINRLYEPYMQSTVAYGVMRNFEVLFQEIDELKKRMLTPKVSLYDWLRMNCKRRCVYLDDLPSIVEDEFPCYGIVILNLREQTVKRKSLMEPAKTAFELLTDWQWPDLCVEHVLSFLRNTALKAMIDAAVEF